MRIRKTTKATPNNTYPEDHQTGAVFLEDRQEGVLEDRQVSREVVVHAVEGQLVGLAGEGDENLLRAILRYLAALAGAEDDRLFQGFLSAEGDGRQPRDVEAVRAMVLPGETLLLWLMKVGALPGAVCVCCPGP